MIVEIKLTFVLKLNVLTSLLWFLFFQRNTQRQVKLVHFKTPQHVCIRAVYYGNYLPYTYLKRIDESKWLRSNLKSVLLINSYFKSSFLHSWKQKTLFPLHTGNSVRFSFYVMNKRTSSIISSRKVCHHNFRGTKLEVVKCAKSIRNLR